MKYCIFGAGQNGFYLTQIMPKGFFHSFIDNDSNKWGKNKAGLPIVSVDDFCGSVGKTSFFTVIFTVHSSSDEELLHNSEIKNISLHDFLNRPEVKEYRDQIFIDRYHYDHHWVDGCFNEKYFTSFRSEYANNDNEALIAAMHQNDQRKIEEILQKPECEKDSAGKYFDEYYQNRFGMRLITRLLQGQSGLRICDLACGHGEQLKALMNENHVLGIDLSEERVAACQATGINAVRGDSAHSGQKDDTFDVVIAEETLEHVIDPVAVIREAWRILKPGGMLYITTPLGQHCDSWTHVRFFTINSIYSLLTLHGFEIDNIITIPYVNENLFDNNIMVGARKLL